MKINFLSKAFLTVVLAMQIYACDSTSSVVPSPTPTPNIPLFTRIGGNVESIAVITDDFIQNITADGTIYTDALFKPIIDDSAKLTVFKQKMTDYICQIAGGSCTYSNDNQVTTSLNLTTDQYNNFKNDLGKTFDKFKILAKDKTDFMNIFDPVKVQMFIVTAPTPVPSVTPVASGSPQSSPQISASPQASPQTSGQVSATPQSSPTVTPSVQVSASP